LTARGVQFESVNYIEKPFSASELRELLHRAGLKPQDVLRSNEPAYKQLVAGKDLSDDELLKVMAAHPELVQRPIVVRDEKAVLARPIENLTKLGL
jgi:arsenate reductase (glutaredoxin)